MKKLILMALVCSALYSSATGYFGLKPIVNEPSCYGDATGSIQLSVLGGTSPITFAWSTNGSALSGTSSTQSGLVGGTYLVTATDANGLTATYSVVMGQPYQITIVTGTVNVTQHGGTNGSVSATVDGGTPNYTYSWSDGETSENISNLPSGTYYVTVTDEEGCQATASKDVTQPAHPMYYLNPNNHNDPRMDVGNTNNNGSKSSSSMSLPNGSAPTLKAEDVQMFPNPASSAFTLKTGEVNSSKITLFDINGQKVSEQMADSNESKVNVSGLPTGNYLVEIRSEDGTVVNKRVTVAK